MKKTFMFIFAVLIILAPLSGCKNAENNKQETQKQETQNKQMEKPREITVKVDRSKQSSDDVDNETTRAIEPDIVTEMKTLNPNYVQEITINTSLLKNSTTYTTVTIDLLFVTGTLNKNKESVFVNIAKQLRNVKSLKKISIWSYEGQMYNSNNANQYMIVVYTKYLPVTGDFTFKQLVDSSNNGSINGVKYFNENRK